MQPLILTTVMERKDRNSGNSKRSFSGRNTSGGQKSRFDGPARPRRDDDGAGKPYRSSNNDSRQTESRSGFNRDRNSGSRFGNNSQRDDKARPGRFSRDDDRGNGGYSRQNSYRDKFKNNSSESRDNDGDRPRRLQLEKSPTAKLSTGEIRLNRFLANAGLCSRREADTLIQTGLVQINGQIITELGVKVKPTDEIKFNNSIVRRERKVYILLNKPKDYITSADDPEKRRTVFELIQDACPERVFPVGRLDRNTTGVLLFTNDGDLADMLMHPKYSKKKIYQVFLDKNLRPDDYGAIMAGIELEDGFVRPDALEYIFPDDHSQVGIEIHSGKNRIVRRIFEHLGYRVEKLDRVYFAGLTKKNLPRGRWRFLTEYEVAMLKKGKFD